MAEILCHGTIARIIVDPGGGQVLVELQISDAAADLPQPGDPVAVEISPRRIRANAAEDAA